MIQSSLGRFREISGNSPGAMYAPLHIHTHVNARTTHSINTIPSQRRQVSKALVKLDLWSLVTPVALGFWRVDSARLHIRRRSLEPCLLSNVLIILEFIFVADLVRASAAVSSASVSAQITTRKMPSSGSKRRGQRQLQFWACGEGTGTRSPFCYWYIRNIACIGGACQFIAVLYKAVNLYLLLLVPLQSTGVEFPEVTTLWEGDKMRSMGAGVRAKKFGFIPVKVPCPDWQCPTPLTAGTTCFPCAQNPVHALFPHA